MGKLILLPSSSLIFSIFLLCVTNLATSQSPLVSKFCHKHNQDPNFCLKIIASDPRFKTAKNARELEILTIALGSRFVRALTNKCSILLQSEKDPNIKAALGSCTGAYALVGSDFDSIRVAFQSERPVSQHAAEATAAVLKCNKEFDDRKLASPLAKNNESLLKIIKIVIANSV